MHIDRHERLWTVIATAIMATIFAIILGTSLALDIHPPSNVETVDSQRLHLTDEFAADNLGVSRGPDGGLVVRLVAVRYAFVPREVTIPADTRITWRLASADVTHGFHVPGTNLDSMVVPGYVSEIHGMIREPGDYAMLCNEYCGVGHQSMWTRITAVPPRQWRARPGEGGR
ncbi:MAG: cytochrome C oxidase subunit II [Pseudomonadota bacterium]